ncbi:MAG: outer membrane lipoprotein-sorting protein [Kiritimatiellia bacterium]
MMRSFARFMFSPCSRLRQSGALHFAQAAWLLFLTFAPLSNAATLLEPVIAALPDIPLVIQGDLQRLDERGRVEQTFRVEMVLDWKAEVATARYTIRDAFGAPLEHLAITWNDPARPDYNYLAGDPLRSAPLPPLHQAIQETDVTWLDLSLSFLWWPGGKKTGEEKVRGRHCDIIELPAPEGQASAFDTMQLWVDSKIGIVLRAEGYSREGDRLRRMDVKSFKKIDDRWVIKDLEFLRYPEKTKTLLRVRDVAERERFEAPAN